MIKFSDEMRMFIKINQIVNSKIGGVFLMENLSIFSIFALQLQVLTYSYDFHILNKNVVIYISAKFGYFLLKNQKLCKNASYNEFDLL